MPSIDNIEGRLNGDPIEYLSYGDPIIYKGEYMIPSGIQDTLFNETLAEQAPLEPDEHPLECLNDVIDYFIRMYGPYVYSEGFELNTRKSHISKSVIFDLLGDEDDDGELRGHSQTITEKHLPYAKTILEEFVTASVIDAVEDSYLYNTGEEWIAEAPNEDDVSILDNISSTFILGEIFEVVEGNLPDAAFYISKQGGLREEYDEYHCYSVIGDFYD